MFRFFQYIFFDTFGFFDFVQVLQNFKLDFSVQQNQEKNVKSHAQDFQDFTERLMRAMSLIYF